MGRVTESWHELIVIAALDSLMALAYRLYGRDAPERIIEKVEGYRRDRDEAATAAREKIPAELRQAVFERDEFRCVDCGATDDLTADHVFPRSLGGVTEIDNLATRCRSCNSRKGARVL